MKYVNSVFFSLMLTFMSTSTTPTPESDGLTRILEIPVPEYDRYVRMKVKNIELLPESNIKLDIRTENPEDENIEKLSPVMIINRSNHNLSDSQLTAERSHQTELPSGSNEIEIESSSSLFPSPSQRKIPGGFAASNSAAAALSQNHHGNSGSQAFAASSSQSESQGASAASMAAAGSVSQNGHATSGSQAFSTSSSQSNNHGFFGSQAMSGAVSHSGGGGVGNSNSYSSAASMSNSGSLGNTGMSISNSQSFSSSNSNINGIMIPRPLFPGNYRPLTPLYGFHGLEVSQPKFSAAMAMANLAGAMANSNIFNMGMSTPFGNFQASLSGSSSFSSGLRLR
ncbi:uncharacterized protein LOC142318042 [Lycorma delicatula]|uniref:uncharacterized protein LOC142318042 n=1 Tax=Lycorma delicatula TaxID=130591 RepID=UPI003F5178DE